MPRAPILPGEIGVPGRPMRPEQLFARAAGEGEIADRQDVRGAIAGLGVTAAVAEGVELLDIAEVEPGLPLDPGAQPDVERAVGARGEGAEGKRVPFAGPPCPARTTRICGCCSRTATIAAFSPSSTWVSPAVSAARRASAMGSGRGQRRQSEHLPLLGKLPAADLLDRRHHAPRAGQRLIAERHQPPVGIGGGRGKPQTPGRDRTRRPRG